MCITLINPLMKDLFRNLFIALSVVLLATSCYNEDNRIAETCADEILNNEEERIDCGGPNCEPCPPSCDNGILDYVDGWQEVGIDCGGPCEELGQLCCENGIWDINPEEPTLSESWVDCKFDNLNPGDVGFNSECPICPTCENGVHDDGEEVTIGGVLMDAIDCDEDLTTDCPPCSELCFDGLLNGGEGPCIDCGGACDNCSDDHCTNGVQDSFQNDPYSNETGIDCGGCACGPCALLCGDGILNGTEVAIDCGGDDCVPCNDISLCSDGILNGYETAVDCYDGNDGESACEPCQTICEDAIMNGLETDTDCGGPDCGPCGNDEVGFLTYYVDGVYYESMFTSLMANRIEGSITPPANPLDALTFSGGFNHTLSFFIQDDEAAATVWGHDENPLQINNEIAIIPNTVLLSTNDGVMYDADHSQGITIEFTTLEYTAPQVAPLPEAPGGIIEGTFSGVMEIVTIVEGAPVEVNITDGQFRLFFTD